MRERLAILIGVLLFLIFYLGTAYWNILTPDDLYFAHNLKLGGVMPAVIYEYTHWSTRFTSVFFNEWFLSMNWKRMIPIRDIISFFLLFLGVLTSLKRYFKSKHLVLQSLFYAIVLFFSILHIQESWFWHCASFTYGWTIGASLLLLGLVRRAYSTWRLVLLSLLSFFIGGASAPIAIMLIIITVLAFYFDSKVNRTYLLSILLMTALSFTILMLGEGNGIRRSMLPETSLLSSVWINIKSLGRLYLILLPKKLPFMLLAAFFTSFVPNEWKLLKWDKYQALMMFGALFLLTAIYHWPIAYTMGEIAADRALAIVFVAYQIFFIVIAWSIDLKKLKGLIWLFPVLMLILCLYFLPIHKTYNRAVNSRYELLQDSDVSSIELERLPSSGFYRNAELTEYGHLKKYFELKDDPRLKD